jgi:hypothetical protein
MSQFIKTTIGKPEQWLIKAASSIGFDFSKLIHETTNEFVDHSMKRHGNTDIHGAATVKSTDFNIIPDILKAPDYVIIGAMRKGTLLNVYAKVDNSLTWLYFEEILISRRNKVLRGKTLYKITKSLLFDDFLKNVSGNKKTDISKACLLNLKENVQTAGGYPGG